MTFMKQNLMDKTDMIKLFMEWASITRREGLLALETKVDEIDDSFLRNGMRMIIDGNDQEFVRDVLMEDINATEERHRSGSLIFSQAGMYAPSLGVLGAVIGLIAHCPTWKIWANSLMLSGVYCYPARYLHRLCYLSPDCE